MTVLLTRTRPPASLAHRRATPEEQKTWEPSDFVRRTCMYCKTAYKNGGGAWVCEHHHEGVE